MFRKSFIVGAVAGALMLCPPVAGAEQVIVGNVQGVDRADIDASRVGSLTVVKVAENSNHASFDVAGSEFLLRRVVGVDVRDESALRLTVEDAKNRGFDIEFSAITDGEGVARFKGVPVGLYMLSERVPEVGDFQQSSDVLIVLPLGDVYGTSWEYDGVKVVKGDVEEVPPTVPPSVSTVVTTVPPADTPSSDVVPEDAPEPEKGRESTAYTGVSVAGFVLAGLLIMVLGFVFAGRRKRS